MYCSHLLGFPRLDRILPLHRQARLFPRPGVPSKPAHRTAPVYAPQCPPGVAPAPVPDFPLAAYSGQRPPGLPPPLTMPQCPPPGGTFQTGPQDRS